MDVLNLDVIVCVFDQAIHSKACKIKWKALLKFQRCIMMMGIFQLHLEFMSILNRRFGDAGLRDALVQSSLLLSALWILLFVEKVTIAVFGCAKLIMKYLTAFSSNNWRTKDLKCIKNFQVILITQRR